MAPEIQKGEAYSDKSDLWSVGVILFELVCGFPPFGGRNKAELRNNIDRGTYKFPPDVKVSKLCKHLITHLLQKSSEKRITWLNFFDHPFIKCDEETYKVLME